MGIPGDLIVVGSDGLFDNIFNDQILELIGIAGVADDAFKTPLDLNEVANAIAKLAHMKAADASWFSPFAEQAVEVGYDKAAVLGGKMDDITVLVAQVTTWPPSRKVH